eukprot:scaffold155757_cov20-Tisochrysis_lutea.AAC.1
MVGMGLPGVIKPVLERAAQQQRQQRWIHLTHQQNQRTIPNKLFVVSRQDGAWISSVQRALCGGLTLHITKA